MKTLLSLLAMLFAVNFAYGQTDVPFVASGPLGSGSWLRFTSSGGSASIQENWGLNLTGSNMQPVKVNNASLMVGYITNNQDVGIGNAYISGNVGIGPLNPTAKLTLAGSGNLNPNSGAETDYNGLNIIFKGENAGGVFNLGGIKMVQPHGAYLDAADMVFSTSLQTLNEKMRITMTGNVGIGTTSPDQKLTVNGTIHSSEVKVDTSIPVPDYVFDADYKLASLTEVKEYIAKNHHLPEMPSAAQIEKDGLKLGEMNTLLLKKVEELTLHLIEKDGKEKEQEKRLSAQQEQITQLNQKVELLLKKSSNLK